MPNLAFYGGRKQATTKFYFSFRAWIIMVPWNSAWGGFGYNWQSKWVGIIAIKTERTQMHFLSDVLVAVASLDLRVPNYTMKSRNRRPLNSAIFYFYFFQVVFVQSIQGSETLTVVPLDEQTSSLQLSQQPGDPQGSPVVSTAADLSSGLQAMTSVSSSLDPSIQQQLPQELTVKQVEAMLNQGLSRQLLQVIEPWGHFTWYQKNFYSGTRSFHLHISIFVYMRRNQHFVPVQVIPVFSPNEILVLVWNFILLLCKLETDFVPGWKSQIGYCGASGACASALARKPRKSRSERQRKNLRANIHFYIKRCLYPYHFNLKGLIRLKISTLLSSIFRGLSSFLHSGAKLTPQWKLFRYHIYRSLSLCEFRLTVRTLVCENSHLSSRLAARNVCKTTLGTKRLGSRLFCTGFMNT